MTERDLRALAAEAGQCAGLQSAQIPGLSVIFRAIAEDAFRAGVRMGRARVSDDPGALFEAHTGQRTPTTEPRGSDGAIHDPGQAHAR